MAYDAFLELDGVKGESTDDKFKDQFEILSYSLGASNPTNIGSASGGASGGRVQLSSFNIMKKSDKASPQLFLHCAAGEHHKFAKLHLRKASGAKGGQAPYLVYEFEKVFIESIQWSGSTGGDDTPMESLSFVYGQIKVTWNPQDKEGKVGKGTPMGWNQITNKKA